jgi:uncharacterized membrane protein YbhN (UPF0104 family)
VSATAPSQVPELRREEVDSQPALDRRRLRNRALLLAFAVIAIVAVISLLPGLAGLRARFAHAQWEWLVLGVVFKLLSGLAYVAVFRAVFCSSMSWRLSGEIGMSELGANALVPTGGAGGLALGAWALRRAGMDTDRIARRSVAFFFLTSVPNVLGVIILGLGMAAGLFGGHAGLALTLLPALIAIAAAVAVLASGRWAGAAQQRLAARRGAEARMPRVLGALAGGVAEALALLRRHDPWLILGLIGYLVFDVLILVCTFNAFGTVPPMAVIWIGYLIGELGGLIPVPGGIGGVDLGLVGTLVLYRVPIGAATAAVLAYRAIALWVPAVVGAGAFVLLQRSLKREALAISECGPGGEVEVIGRGRVRISAGVPSATAGEEAGASPQGASGASRFQVNA